jgi:hypothetical protein
MLRATRSFQLTAVEPGWFALLLAAGAVEDPLLT